MSTHTQTATATVKKVRCSCCGGLSERGNWRRPALSNGLYHEACSRCSQPLSPEVRT